MATPSSSATSPSPALSYALPARSSASDSATSSATSDDRDREQDLADREQCRRNLLARAEFAKITRALRTTLALAGFKAKHNMMTVPFRALEERVRDAAPATVSQPQSQSQTFYGLGTPPTAAAAAPNGVVDKKRKASSSLINNYNSPLGYGFQSPYPSNYPYASSSNTSAYNPGPSNATQSLFASILAPPPAKRARTIHNPEAPPIPPPLPPERPPTKKGNSRKGKEPAGKNAEKGQGNKSKKSATKSATRGRERAGSVSSTRTRSSYSGDTTEPVNDTDIKAAATLTEIMFSRTGATVGSPRSSFSQASVSSARSGVGPPGPAFEALPLSQSSSTSGASVVSAPADVSQRRHARTDSGTSTRSIRAAELQYQQQQQMLSNAPLTEGMDVDALGRHRSMTPTATPRMAARTVAGGGSGGLSNSQSQGANANVPGRAADTEAADLMLLLANSPSPARPTVTRDKDRTPRVFAASRVLFPSAGENEDGLTPRNSGFPPAVSGSSRSPPRGAGEPIVTPPTPRSADGSPLASPSSSQQTIPMNSQEAHTMGSLLPAPPSPSPSRLDAAVSGSGLMAPQTPAAFDMSDYINVSPSPAVVARQSGSANALPLSQLSQSSTLSSSSMGTLSAHPSSSSQTLAPGTPGRIRTGASSVGVSSPLRKSIDASALGMGVGLGVAGRRLFENEAAAGGSHRPNAGPLGSGIDLVRT